MRGKGLLITGVIVLAGIAVGALAWHRHSTAPPPPPPQKAEAPLPGDITLSGKIRAQHVVAVGATVGGNIEAFLVEIGQEVAEGQVLARVSNQGLETGREVATIALDNAQSRVTKLEAQLTSARLEASRAQADASRARTDLDRAEKTYSRQRMLHGEGATPRQMYEKATREFETAKADSSSLDIASKQADERIQSLLEQLQSARKILDDKQKQLEDASGALAATEIHSPVDGIVVGRKGEVGKSAQEQGSDLFQIAIDTLALEVVVEPEPPVLARIKAGQPALVLISDFQSEGIPAKVKEVKDTLVMVEFTSPNPAIKPGLTAEVRIKLD
jgi:HlyD family secretion protein